MPTAGRTMPVRKTNATATADALRAAVRRRLPNRLNISALKLLNISAQRVRQGAVSRASVDFSAGAPTAIGRRTPPFGPALISHAACTPLCFQVSIVTHSHHDSLSRSPRRPRKTKMCPENGFSASALCTRALKPPKPRRMSVTPVTIQIRVLPTPIAKAFMPASSRAAHQ